MTEVAWTSSQMRLHIQMLPASIVDWTAFVLSYPDEDVYDYLMFKIFGIDQWYTLDSVQKSYVRRVVETWAIENIAWLHHYDIFRINWEATKDRDVHDQLIGHACVNFMNEDADGVDPNASLRLRWDPLPDGEDDCV